MIYCLCGKGSGKLARLMEKYGSFFKFLLVGGSSTLIDFIIYLLLSMHLDITISKVLSMVVASFFSYMVNKKWTFVYDGKTNFNLIFKYIFSQLINISVNTFVNTFIYNWLGLKIIAFVIATGVAMIVNYLLQKFLVFKRSGESV